jgi:Ca-activated chloride channel family protein
MSRSALQAQNGELIIEVAVQAPDRKMHTTTRMPFNIAIALDVSSSMQGDKIRHAKQAAQRIITRLEPQDSCAVVIFSSESQVLFPSTAMTPHAREAAIAEIEKTVAEGNTALYAGWNDAVNAVEQSAIGAQAIQRVFLLTDGEANIGPADTKEVARAVAAVQQRGISTTTFGLGQGYNERLLGLMASAGEGNTYFIQDADDIDAYFGQELDQLFTTTLRNTVVSVTIPAEFSYEVVGDRNHSRAGAALTIPLGALLSGEARTFLLYLHTHRAPNAPGE